MRYQLMLRLCYAVALKIMIVEVLCLFSLPAFSQPLNRIDSLRQELVQAEQQNDAALKARAYLAMARHYQQQNELRSSIEFLNKCLAISTKASSQAQTAECYRLLGANYHSLSLYETSLTYYFKALSIHEALQDQAAIASDFNSIGRVYQYTRDFDDALRYFSKALAFHTSQGDEEGKMVSLLNIGVIHQKKSSFDSALYYYRKALPFAVKLGLKSDEAKLTGNIGSTLVQQGKLEEGLVYLEKALALKEKAQNLRSMLHTLNDIADAKVLLGDAKGAKVTAEKVVGLAKAYEEGNQLRWGYHNLSRSYKMLGDYEQAYHYLAKYDAIKDSLFGINKAQQINQLQIQYETEKKDQAIASLEQEKELEDTKKRAYFILGAVLLVASALLYNSQRLKTKKHKQLLEKEKEVDRLKSNFFANISHEFRTPLTLILGPIETLLAKTTDPEARLQLGFMKESAARLLRLINQILDLSKLESGHLELRVKKIDIIPVLKGVSGSFSSMADSRHVRLSFESDLSVQPLYCDPAQIETILINLLSNAFKFSQEGGHVKVSVAGLKVADADAEAGRLEISVSDTGAGISAEQVERIFDRFYQAGHAAASFYGGTGIGLALSKELVEMHGGSISVHSQLGMGTTVCISLPLGSAHFKETQIQSEEPYAAGEVLVERAEELVQESAALSLAAAAPADEKQPILLLVEDNEDVRAYIRTILQAAYTLIEAVNGEEGVRLAVEHIPDLIISDVMMPRMNGYEFCRYVKQDERTSHIPIILLTAKASVHSRIEGLETEADLYLSKPFVPHELRLCIRNLIQSRLHLRERYQKQIMLRPREIAVNSVDEQFLERLMQVMESNYADESFTVDQLSKEMGMSRSQLHRKLEALTNESSSHFIRTFRLQRAMDLLKKKHATIAEIAYQVGFASPSYFNRCFLKQYGVTPSSVMGS